MNKMDARRKQILSLIYMVGLYIFSFLFEKLGAKAGGYLLVIALILVCFFLPFFARFCICFKMIDKWFKKYLYN